MLIKSTGGSGQVGIKCRTNLNGHRSRLIETGPGFLQSQIAGQGFFDQSGEFGIIELFPPTPQRSGLLGIKGKVFRKFAGRRRSYLGFERIAGCKQKQDDRQTDKFFYTILHRYLPAASIRFLSGINYDVSVKISTI